MGKFKKGDWVRRTVGSSIATLNGSHEAGFVGQVADVVEDYGQCLDFTNGHRGYADKYEPWRPKVGERVRVIYGHRWNGEGELVKVSDFDCFIVLMKSGERSGREGGFMIKDLEPILTPEQPATLKIKAGRFYKTRDGRKVGPMSAWHGLGSGEYHWTNVDDPEKGRLWREDGTSGRLMPEHDLIAEWIDEPVAKASTTKPSNDNATPKFKVGDMIRHKTLKYEGVVEAVLNEETVRTHWTKEGWGANDPVEDIELINTTPTPTTTTIVALIENGQPKPSSTPHVHTSADAAEKEAKRLAAKYKGQKFGVFKLTTTHEEARVYEHEWQNMAAMGLKSDAISSLKTQAGITTDQARRIVYAFAA